MARPTAAFSPPAPAVDNGRETVRSHGDNARGGGGLSLVNGGQLITPQPISDDGSGELVTCLDDAALRAWMPVGHAGAQVHALISKH
jgi:hypothetical protein